MEGMSFFSLTRVRCGACAAALLLALAAPAPAHASDLEDKHISPGQMLLLEPSDEGSFTVNTEKGAPLPAGWSAVATKEGLRLSAPATAKEAESVEVFLVRAGEVVDEFVVKVAETDSAEASTPSSSSGESGSSAGWLDSLRERLHSFFG